MSKKYDRCLRDNNKVWSVVYFMRSLGLMGDQFNGQLVSLFVRRFKG